MFGRENIELENQVWRMDRELGFSCVQVIKEDFKETVMESD